MIVLDCLDVHLAFTENSKQLGRKVLYRIFVFASVVTDFCGPL